MGTKTISILNEAYNALVREKGKTESFSDVILKLTGRRGRFVDSLGKWKMTDKEAKEMEESLSKAWKTWGRGHKWTV
ncbi:MAG: antitoxin VapB family protein [Ignavibacteriae bacterium]|nr:antitoxin VapB family protein [Ignavibacteriota bacterium]